MTAPIRLLVERGQLLVGDEAFPGGVTPDGGLSVGGHDVRPLRLAERDHLLAVAADLPAEGPHDTRRHAGGPHVAGPDAAGRLARLLGALAAPTARGADVHLLAAVEAVALYLAGAAMSGPLARTTLLVARATGLGDGGIGSMGALDADRLAEVLAAGLDTTGSSEPAATGSSEPDVTGHGWTTISFEPATVVAPGRAAEGAAVVRDRLAARLIARDGQSLSRQLLDRLLDPGDTPGRDGDPAQGGGGSPGDRPAANASLAGSVSTAPADRWLAPSGSSDGAPPRTGPPADRRGVESSGVVGWGTDDGGADRWGQRRGGPGTDDRGRGDRDPPGADSSRRPAVSRSVAAADSLSARPVPVGRLMGPDETSDAGTVGPDRSGDAGGPPWSEPGVGQQPAPPTGRRSAVAAVAAAGGQAGQTSGQRSASSPSTFSSRPRTPDALAPSAWWPQRPTPRSPVHDPGGRARVAPDLVGPPAAVVRPAASDDRDPDEVARALEHVADLHGLPR